MVYAQVMEIAFSDPALALIEGDEAGRTKLPVAVIKSARRKLLVLRAAVDDRSLRNWKSLHYEESEEVFEGQQSIRLDGQFHMVITLSVLEPLTATILSIKDCY